MQNSTLKFQQLVSSSMSQNTNDRSVVKIHQQIQEILQNHIIVSVTQTDSRMD